MKPFEKLALLLQALYPGESDEELVDSIISSMVAGGMSAVSEVWAIYDGPGPTLDNLYDHVVIKQSTIALADDNADKSQPG